MWLVLFLILSRLLYLPSSQALAGSEHSVLEAPRNTAIVLEGIASEGAPAITIAFEDVESFTLDSGRAVLTDRTRAQLAGLGARLPGAGPHALSWNINVPPGEDAEPGFLRVEIAPTPGKNVAIGMLNGNLRLGSNSEVELTPVTQDFAAIGGWLRLDGHGTGAPEDFSPQFRLLPDSSGEGHAIMAWRASDPELILGDPFGADNGLQIRSIAHVDEGGRLLARYCGAERSGILLSTMFQLRLDPQPPADACNANYLRASMIRFDKGAIEVELGGTAYVAGASQLFEKLRGNIVLWPVLAALIAIPGQKLLAAFLALFAKKDQSKEPA